jgi:hypothetical protein
LLGTYSFLDQRQLLLPVSVCWSPLIVCLEGTVCTCMAVVPSLDIEHCLKLTELSYASWFFWSFFHEFINFSVLTCELY